MITIDEAIRHCEEIAEKCDLISEASKTIKANRSYRKCAEEHKQLAEWLRELQRYQWIPCNERLPEEREWIGTKKFGTTISDEVLVTFESRGERFVRPIHFQNGELGGMDKHTMDAVHGEWKAVAWMPLPEPYEPKEEDE